MFESVDAAPSTSRVLARARTARRTADRAEADVLLAAVEWAEAHPAESIHDAATLIGGGESAVAIAGEGAPLVAEFCLAELAAALHLPTVSGRELVADALELKYRLPKVWHRVVVTGDLQVWRARRIAHATTMLTADAAGFVDTQIARFAHRVGPAEVERLIAEATNRYMPAAAAAARAAAADARHVTINSGTVSFHGTCWITGEVDLADALDLDTALATGAAALAGSGCVESLDVRRSLALGDLARGETPLPITDECEETAVPTTRSGREVVLHVHLTEDSEVARLDHAGWHLLTKDQVRAWCGAPTTTRITIKPVIDLAEHVHVVQYEVPDRLADQVALRDVTCVFPYCNRTARACDTDHIVAYDDGGPTSSDNLAALCRRHHRHKTHHPGWTYTMLEPGSYLWHTPHGLAFLRDHHGTTEISTEIGTGSAAHPPDW